MRAELDEQPAAWVSYGLARLHTADPAGAQSAWTTALREGDPETRAEALRCLLQLKCTVSVAPALQFLEDHLGEVREAPLSSLELLWKTCAAGAVLGRDSSLLQRTLRDATAWAAATDHLDAAFVADLAVFNGALLWATEQRKEALRAFGKAVHLCPSPPLRVGLAAAALGAAPAPASIAPAVLHLLTTTAGVQHRFDSTPVATAGKVRE